MLTTPYCVGPQHGPTMYWYTKTYYCKQETLQEIK
jgi:hypothetical protein